MSPSPGPVDPLDRRIGDAERTVALEALGQHLSAGRIDLTEFSERSGRVTTARTARELAALFDDLPDPHPPGPPSVTRAVQPTSYGPVRDVPAPVPVPRQRDSTVLAITAIGALLVFLVLGRLIGPLGWVVFLAVPIVALLMKAARDRP